MWSPITYYSRKEELFNVLSHFLGFILSIAATVLLITFAAVYGNVWQIISFSIFGATLITLYLASTLYHAARKKNLRRKLNILDHAAIYLLIAGTYTPYCLVALHGAIGWVLLGVTWGLALIGIILKLFYTGRFNILSTVGYVAMGWVAVLAAKPLYENLESGALLYLILGGMCYTIGAVFYAIERIPYNHAIFHIWVLAGSILHFVSIFFYLL